MRTVPETKRAFLKYLAGLLLFGSNGVIASYIHLSSYEIVLLRSVLGIALLLGLFLIVSAAAIQSQLPIIRTLITIAILTEDTIKQGFMAIDIFSLSVNTQSTGRS